MIDIALFDADGVVIKKRNKYFSERLVTDYGVSAESAQEFIQKALIPSMTERLDLKDIFGEYLNRWGIKKSSEEMFQYWWSKENTVNTQVLQLVDQIRTSQFKTYLATDQERYRAAYLLETVGLHKHFDGAFFSYQLGAQKHDKEFWEKLLGTLKVDPNQIMFWDDDLKNVDRAASLGIISRQYTDFEEFKRETFKLITPKI